MTNLMARVTELVKVGDFSEIDRLLCDFDTGSCSDPMVSHEKHHIAWIECLRATVDGQARRAEQLANEALGLAQKCGDPDSQVVWGTQLAIIRWMQGRVVELEPDLLRARQSAPHESLWGACLAWLWVQQGRIGAARALVASLGPVSKLPSNRNWLATVCFLAIAAADLGEVDLAKELREALLPFEGHLVTMGPGATVGGTVSRPLALLASTVGEPDAAIVHYRRAVDLAARSGAHAWLAETQLELAALLANPPPGAAFGVDLAEAQTLVADALSTARSLHLPAVEERAGALLACWAGQEDTAESEQAGLPEVPRARIRVLGLFEATSADRTLAHWQSRKARHLLKMLVANRGRAVSRDTLMHQLWPDEPPERLANRFSVALSTIRRLLDPLRAHPRDYYLEARSGLVRLRVDRIDVDVEDFFALAETGVAATEADERRADLLMQALALHRGDLVVDLQDETWAQDFRRTVHIAFFAVCHALAEIETVEPITRLDCYRRILELDPYDRRAHEGQLALLSRLGAIGEYRRARAHYERQMTSLGVLEKP